MKRSTSRAGGAVLNDKYVADPLAEWNLLIEDHAELVTSPEGGRSACEIVQVGKYRLSAMPGKCAALVNPSGHPCLGCAGS